MKYDDLDWPTEEREVKIEQEEKKERPPAAKVGYFKLIVPGSMKNKYRVMARTQFVNNVITEIDYISCGCIGGLSGDCPHAAELLLAIHNTIRPNVASASTAALCLWNMPSSGICFDFRRPIFYIPFTHDDINQVVKSENVCTSAHSGRANWNCLPPGATLADPDDPEVVFWLAEWYEELEDYYQEKCAFEVQWGLFTKQVDNMFLEPLDGDRHPGDS